MGQPKITEIEAQLGEWEFLKELPQEIDGFNLILPIIMRRTENIMSFLHIVMKQCTASLI